ncbi:MAG: Protein translocase subunit SecA [Candidatus Uhrbacteria bacterium GW2011_GWD2_52_7]|uniref:Protein translocase subunit SecA n=1 Tax=Candidatus Uhrbacteria bacterium GW2011_GWD2_52_7 TaxID=1618989 RepID=A0A0G1ZPE3_9BACT|nr:MAG: Protein translocase subunit SecA [Candidatus Uhrbacteria bacterium GW2011_GWD2_52_7]
MSILTKLLGDPNAKLIKGLRKEADQINAFESTVAALSNDELRAKTAEFKQRLVDGATLNDISLEAFAVAREAAKRTLGQRQYDVQMMGGLVLHRGQIAEMRTGEGKTLTATAPVYLNALSGKGVHIVTVNDYLAKRDAVWMGQVFHFLGLTIGVIQHESGYRYDENFKAPEEVKEADDAKRDTTGSFRVQMDFLRPSSRKEAYDADVTYGTNNEFGFDYLRDNMAPRAADMVQRDLNFAIVDEVDSILIDEARTPLIISAPAEESTDLYYKFAAIAQSLHEGEDYNLDEKLRVSTFTEAGLQKVEKGLGVANLYESGLEMVHHAEQALRAHSLFKIDRDYVVRDGEVMIVDEFTGRIMEGRRYSEGLHQAIEAKESVKIQRESRTLATITFQNYFRMYQKLGGMTGTAATEAEEFSKIYKLEVVTIPTHNPIKRNDLADRIYKSEQGKWMAVVEEVKARHEKGQPVLIGTVSIDKNQRLSEYLRLAGIPHNVLNAKNHEKEAEYIAQAGRRGGVTLATNMAGRGVDIILGGNPPDGKEVDEVRALGGLHVIGTERHESRRIDNQLRGRAGRQGDPGSTQFFVSLDDDLMRIFGSERVKRMMDTLGLDDSTPIESKMVTRSLEKAQQRVEGHHFDTRKHVLEYDDVLNKHRVAIYRERRELLLGGDEKAHEAVMSMVEREIERVVLFHTSKSEGVPVEFVDAKESDWNPKEILETLVTIAPLEDGEKEVIITELKELSKDKEKLAHQRSAVIEAVMASLKRRYDDALKLLGDAKALQRLERTVLLRSIDSMWMRHLDDMTYLRRTIGLQGYAQRDPLVEYKKESYRLYGAMREEIAREVSYNLFKIIDQTVSARKVFDMAPQAVRDIAMQMMGGNASSGTTSTTTVVAQQASAPSIPSSNPTPDFSKAKRNEPCPCGSGKKFKKCHGKE